MKGALLPFLLLPLSVIGGVAAFPLTPHDAATEAAIVWFEARTQANGCIASGAASSCSYGSTSDALLALSAVGVDPARWPPWGTSSSLAYFGSHARDAGTTVTFCRACEWAKAVVVTAAIGQDPRRFGDVDAVAELDSYFDGVQVGSRNQVNDDFWALYAYRAAEEPTSGTKVQSILNFILARQNPDGGWAWNLSPVSESWATPSAILAVLAHGHDPSALPIQRAVSFLQTQQAESGLILYANGETAEQTALTIQAVTAVGDDPTGPNWTRNGANLVSGLLGLQRSDGGFAHEPAGSSNWMATWQSLPSLPGVPYPYRPPTVVASANPTQTMQGSPISFECSATDPDGAMERVEWHWGDGSPTGGPTASHAYANAGTYWPECMAFDDDGVARSQKIRITVAAPTTSSSPTTGRSSPTTAASSSSPSHPATTPSDHPPPLGASPSTTPPTSTSSSLRFSPTGTAAVTRSGTPPSTPPTAEALDEASNTIETRTTGGPAAVALESPRATTPGPAIAVILALLALATALTRRPS